MREVRPQGPAVRWHPWKAERHALRPETRHSDEGSAPALCGCHVELGEPEAADWFFPTCAACMEIATRPSEDATRSDRAAWR